MPIGIKGHTQHNLKYAGTTISTAARYLRGGEVGGEQEQALQQARQPALLHQRHHSR